MKIIKKCYKSQALVEVKLNHLKFVKKRAKKIIEWKANKYYEPVYNEQL
jgi:hypothetical protein